MKKVIIWLFAWMCVCNFTQTVGAQSRKDTVFLSNSNLLIGKVYKYMPDKYLCIQTRDGQFTFELSDVKKLCIHSVSNYKEGIDEDITPIKKVSDFEVDVERPKDNVPTTEKPQNIQAVTGVSTPHKTSASKQTNRGSQYDDDETTPVLTSHNTSFYDDHFPENLFIVQGQMCWADQSPTLRKYQVIYSRRIEKELTFGYGMACGRYSGNEKLVNAFWDVRQYFLSKNSYYSIAADFGVSSDYSNGSFYLGASFNWGTRIAENLFLQLGINYSQESYGTTTTTHYDNYGGYGNYSYDYTTYDYQRHHNLGINVGILF